jgi:hypothetical protein
MLLLASIHEQDRARTRREPLTSPAPALDPKHTALLVMDFQHGVVERMPGLDSLLARVQQAIEIAGLRTLLQGTR